MEGQDVGFYGGVFVWPEKNSGWAFNVAGARSWVRRDEGKVKVCKLVV